MIIYKRVTDYIVLSISCENTYYYLFSLRVYSMVSLVSIPIAIPWLLCPCVIVFPLVRTTAHFHCCWHNLIRCRSLPIAFRWPLNLLSGSFWASGLCSLSHSNGNIIMKRILQYPWVTLWLPSSRVVVLGLTRCVLVKPRLNWLVA